MVLKQTTMFRELQADVKAARVQLREGSPIDTAITGYTGNLALASLLTFEMDLALCVEDTHVIDRRWIDS